MPANPNQEAMEVALTAILALTKRADRVDRQLGDLANQTTAAFKQVIEETAKALVELGGDPDLVRLRGVKRVVHDANGNIQLIEEYTPERNH